MKLTNMILVTAAVGALAVVAAQAKKGETGTAQAAAPTAESDDTSLSICAFNPNQRINYRQVSPGGVEALSKLEQHVQNSGLERNLIELVKLRASQLNGCAYCLDMHTKDARSRKETEQRIFLVPVWREAPCYSDRERAAFAWTEAVTHISKHEVSDALYREVSQFFSEKELVDLTYAIVAINSWNRLAIAMRMPVGGYTPKP